MASDPLRPTAVVEAMAEALPTHEKDDTTSDLSSSLDCVALFVHACMANLGFRLLGFNEDQKIGTQPAGCYPLPTLTTLRSRVRPHRAPSAAAMEQVPQFAQLRLRPHPVVDAVRHPH
jgi:hypothetical protein